MVGLTVGEMRAAALPPDATLVGGQAGLDRTVAGATMMRARTPAFPTLHGGEVALIALALVRQMEPRLRLSRLLAQLADASVVAVVFFGGDDPAAAFGDELAAVEQSADQHALPVFVVPPPHTPETVELALHRALSARRDDLLRRSHEVQQAFTALALSGRGPVAIVERLAAVTGLPAVWEDVAGDLVAAAVPGDAALASPELAGFADLAPGIPALVRGATLPLLRWRNSLGSGGADGTAPANEGGAPAGEGAGEVAVLPLRAEAGGRAAAWRRMVVPFSVDGRPAGFVSVFGRAGADTRERRLALSGAALAASIEALRAHAVTEGQGSALAGLVSDWFAGRFAAPAELAARASHLGYPLRPPYAVAIVESHALLGEAAVRRLAHALTTVAAGADRPEPRGVLPLPAPRDAAPLWTAIDHARTALLVPLGEAALSEATAVAVHDALRSLAAAAEQADVSGQTSGGSFAGIGRPAAGVGDVPRAYREARQALGVARRLGGGHRAAYFGSLGVYRLLAAVEPAGELSAFCEDVLGPLRAQDQRSGGELLRTLEAYLMSGGSPQLTAERLHTHRNTILYRLERIQRLLGVDLRQPERQLTLHLALRAAEMLGEAGPRPSPGGNTAAVTLPTGR